MHGILQSDNATESYEDLHAAGLRRRIHERHPGRNDRCPDGPVARARQSAAVRVEEALVHARGGAELAELSTAAFTRDFRCFGLGATKIRSPLPREGSDRLSDRHRRAPWRGGGGGGAPPCWKGAQESEQCTHARQRGCSDPPDPGATGRHRWAAQRRRPPARPNSLAYPPAPPPPAAWAAADRPRTHRPPLPRAAGQPPPAARGRSAGRRAPCLPPAGPPTLAGSPSSGRPSGGR
jgi:hypothetical protein